MLRFQNLLDSFELKFQEEIRTIQAASPVQLYEPVAYSLNEGGKRIRPVLLLHAASLFTDRPEQFFPAAAAIELFHNFTLLHDDIMDHAAIRRGLPSVHVKYGENSAILSGDAMSIMAFRFLSRCDPRYLSEVLSLFSETALEVCEGQQLDMEFENNNLVSIPEYLEMIRLKTAVLIGCSLKTGAILAGASKTECQLLYDYGINIGTAFQLQDDWLDVYGDEKSFGKKIGGDITENKKTFILLKALEISDQENRSELEDWIGKKDFDAAEKIEAVREIFTRTGAAEKTRTLMRTFYDNALTSLDQLNVPDAAKDELRIFAGKVLSRSK
jgi:geranylgeranyl diphosphate synthase type II